MSVSIYYTAERDMPLTVLERENVNQIVEQYNKSFDYAEDAESFDLYNYDDSEPQTILAGATKIPVSMEMDALVYTINHWLQCLTEIRLIIDDAQWHVHLDDSDALWVEDEWQMPE